MAPGGTVRSWLLPWTRLLKDRRYLERELAARMQGEKVRVLAARYSCPERHVSEARLADAAKPLPRRSSGHRVGELHLDRIVTGAEATELERLVFSPTHLVDGVDVYPGDEIMAARAAAYSASHLARAGARR